MQIIKFDAIDSTSAFLRDMIDKTDVPDRTVVWALEQHSGKGQPGREWESEGGKNLTFSILCKFDSFNVKDNFMLNILISKAIYRVLKSYDIPELSVKWPNDIMSGNFKICGILIENQLRGNQLHRSIIGVGLNVNQESFNNLPFAASLYQLTGNYFELEPLLENLVLEISTGLPAKIGEVIADHLNSYQSMLYGLNASLRFKNIETNEFFEGIIRGVNPSGLLEIEHNQGSYRSYNFRTIQLISRL
jgi:BirA family biotin operon repressor/biotin-[acetyl-CoA-carboxylase] ligase